MFERRGDLAYYNRKKCYGIEIANVIKKNHSECTDSEWFFLITLIHSTFLVEL